MGSSNSGGFFEDWPAWSKPTLALAAMVLLGAIWIGIPLVSAFKLIEPRLQPSGVVDYRPMMAVLIAMTTMTISAIFIFMTFRIDRGTRLTAESVAKGAAEKKVNEVAEGKFKAKLDDFGQKLDQMANPDAIEEAVRNRIPEQEFRKHVQAVLLANANGRIIKEYAKAHAVALDAPAAKELVGLLNDTVKSLSRHIEAKRRQERARLWAARRAALVGWWHRVTGKGN